MTVKEYMQKERESCQWAQVVIRKMQSDYFQVMEKMIAALEFYANSEHIDENGKEFSWSKNVAKDALMLDEDFNEHE